MALTSVLAGGVAGCSSAAQFRNGSIRVLAAENQYGDIAQQIGGRYVSVISVESNPNVDPHSYELSPRVASEADSAQVIVQNGLGYDGFMNKVEAATPNPHRNIVDVRRLLGLPSSTPNPHLWYEPQTMRRLAISLEATFGALQPSHRGYFSARASAFFSSLNLLGTKIASFKAKFGGQPVAVTEPVADYLLQDLGLRILTPFAFQAKVMNGVDLSPQEITAQNKLLSTRQVKAFVYNEQVTDPVTESFVAEAEKSSVPVVGAFETMPTPGFNYQNWMAAELNALSLAIDSGMSSRNLQQGALNG